MLLEGAQHELIALAVRLFEERGAHYLYEEVLAPSLHDIGTRWQSGAVGVADEHVATALVRDCLAAVLLRCPWAEGGPRALVGCVEGERHDIAARIVNDSLALGGWSSLFLGADVPTCDFVEKSRSLDPQLIAISVTLAEHVPALGRLIPSLRRVTPQAKIVVGGAGIADVRDPSAIGADAVASPCSQLVDLAAAWRAPSLPTEATVPVSSTAAPREELSLIVAHDLRQPVNTIAIAANLLLDLQATVLPPSDLRIIERIRAAALRLDRMIDDLANTALIESGRLLLKPERVELRSLVESVIESHATAGGDQAVQLAPGACGFAWADPARVQQVVENLLSNAAKYGSRNTPIYIEVLPHADAVEVVVKNRGTVVAQDQLGLLFEKFTRSRTARESGKPGLGSASTSRSSSSKRKGGGSGRRATRTGRRASISRCRAPLVSPGERHRASARPTARALPGFLCSLGRGRERRRDPASDPRAQAPLSTLGSCLPFLGFSRPLLPSSSLGSSVVPTTRRLVPVDPAAAHPIRTRAAPMTA